MKTDYKFGDVVLRRGVHIMVVDPKPAAKKGDWGHWLGGIQLTEPKPVYGLTASREIAYYNRAECLKVEP